MVAQMLDERMKQFSELFDKMEGLKAVKPKPSSKSSATKSKGIVSALRAHYGGSSASSSSRAAADKSEDEDGAEDGAEEEQSDEKEKEPDRYAPVVLANARTAGSVLNWVKAETWNHKRNYYDCRAIAAAIDALLEEGVDADGKGIEILCRRLSGVHTADKFNNWEVCKSMEYPYASETLLDQRLLSRALKDASTRTRIQDRANKTSSSGFKRRNNKYGNNNNNNNNKTSSTFKSIFGVGSGSAGAAQR